MALQRTRLTEIVLVSDSIGSVYANPAATKTFIRGFCLINRTTTAKTVVVHLVPDTAGALGTPSDDTMLLPLLTLAGYETLFIDLPYAYVMIDENESVQAIANVVDSINLIVFGDLDS
jgi:hypothetical protein